MASCNGSYILLEAGELAVNRDTQVLDAEFRLAER